MWFVDTLKWLYNKAVDLVEATFDYEGPRAPTPPVQQQQVQPITQAPVIGRQQLPTIQAPKTPLQQMTEWAISSFDTQWRAPEPTGIFGKAWQFIGDIGKAAYGNIVKPLVVVPNAINNVKKTYFNDNSANLSPFFDPGNDGDWDTMDQVSGLYKQKRELLNDETRTLDEKAPEIDNIQNKINMISSRFSKYDEKQKPADVVLQDLTKKYDENKKQIEKTVTDIMWNTTSPEQVAWSEIRQNWFNKLMWNDIYWVKIQGNIYRWKELDQTDMPIIGNKLISSPEIDGVLTKPEEMKQRAALWLSKATTPEDKAFYQSKLDQANKMIDDNNKYVLPYMRWMITNLGKEGNSISQLTQRYTDITWRSPTDIFWESESLGDVAKNMFNIPNALQAIFSPASIANKAIKLTRAIPLNRWDVADQAMAEMKMKEWNLFQKGMEGIGQVFSKAENALNTAKWLLYMWSFWGLGRMDMEALTNIDSQIAPPKWWAARTWSSLRNFTTRAAQMWPEIALQIVPFVYGGWVLDAAGDAKLLAKLWKAWQLGTEAGKLMQEGYKTDALAARLAKFGAEYPKLVAEWAKPLDTINTISKWDYFMTKILTEPAKILMNSYIQSAAMQGHNPKEYGTTDFFVDTMFGALDTIIAAGQIANHYWLDNIKHKDIFIENVAKNFWDIPESDWKLLQEKDKQSFRDITQKYINEYNSAMEKFNPDELSKYIKEKIKAIDILPVSTLFDNAKKDKDFVLDWSHAIDKKIIPSYMNEKDFNTILSIAKNEREAIEIFQKIKDNDALMRLKWKPETKIKAVAKQFVDEVALHHLYDTDTAKWSLSNIIKDVDNTLGNAGIIKLDWEQYRYVKIAQKLEKWDSRVFKFGSKSAKSKEEMASTRYLLLEPGENIKRDEEWFMKITDSNWNFLPEDEQSNRLLSFYKKYDGWTVRGTYNWESVGRKVDTIEAVRKNDAVLSAIDTDEKLLEKMVMQKEWVSTTRPKTAGEETTKQVHDVKKIVEQNTKLSTNTEKWVTDYIPEIKTHWFSTLNDILKKSNIDNDWFQLQKAEYTIWDVKLHEILSNVADKSKDGARLTDEELEMTRQFCINTANTFFPQYPALVAKIEKKLKSLNYNQSLVPWAARAENEISVLSRLAWDGWLWEFMKFFDRDKFKELRDVPEAYKQFFNVNFPDDDWFKYRKLRRYIGNDTTQSQRIKSISKFFGADVYRVGQTLFNIAGIPKLLVMNTLAFVTENMRKYNINNYTNKELYNLRKDLNILYSADEYANRAYESLNELNDEGMAIVAKKLQTKIIDLYRSGLYNAADVFFSKSIKNQSLWQALEEVFPHLKWMDEVMSFIKNLPEVERLDKLKQINSRAEELFNKRTGQYVDFWKWKMAFGWEYWLNQIKEASYWTYTLMWSRWVGMMKSSIETLAQAHMSKLIRWSFGKEYIEILQNVSKLEADKRALDYVQKNDDFLHLFEKMNTALALWFKQNRVMADDDGEKDFITTLKEWFELGKNYSFPMQSFESNPFWRWIIAFISGLADDVANDGRITGMDFASAWVNFWKQFLTDFTRRFSLVKAGLTATSQTISRWEGPTAWLSNMIDSFQKATGGFLYYSAQELTENGFDLYIPLTSKSYLQEIMPYTDKYLEEFRDMDGKASMERLLTDFNVYGPAWLMYNIPFYKDWNIGKFEDKQNVDLVTDTISHDNFFQENILKWIIDWETLGDDWKQYAYAQLTNGNSLWKNQNWFDDMRKNFNFVVDWKEIESKTKQNQEDLFVAMLKDSMSNWEYNTFMKMFSESATTNQKAATQMLAFAEKQTPGAGKEMLANIVSAEWFSLLGKYWWWVNSKPDPKISGQIQQYLWEKYWNLMFITDKPVGRKNMSLFYARKEHPELESHLSSPYDKDGRASVDINFIYPNSKSEEGDPYKNKIMNQMYAVDLIAKIAVANGDSNGFKMANAFSTIWMPKWTDEKSLAYAWMALKWINQSLDYFKTCHLPEEEKLELMSWTLVGVYNKMSALIKPLLESEHREVVLDTMKNLHGVSAWVTQLAKEKWAELYFKDTYGTSFSNSKYYSNKFKYYSAGTMYDQLQKLSYLYSPYKTYGTSKSYWGRYYTEKERDYLVAYGKTYWSWVARISNNWRQTSEKAEPSGRTPVQKWGSARAFTKTEDPDKLIDFTLPATFKRKFSRKAVKYDNRSTWKSGFGWWLYNVSYQGGNRKRRVSRTKGSNTKGSVKYNKTSW